MKKLLSVSVLSLFISDAFADDWRMRKFDFNADNVISEAELIQGGCQKVGKIFDHADKNGDNVLNRREAKNATWLIFKNKKRCPAIVAPIATVDIRG